ncbi:DEAD/DEAH box helicase family protein [Staphylococcus saprophyticus]
MIINSEQVAHVTKGVIFKNNRWHCVQCETDDAKYFHRYFSDFIKRDIIYCRKCIQLGRMDHLTDYKITKSHQKATLCEYHLEFELSDQQRYASQQIVNAIMERRKLLLYAVTGAGKTEMIFEGIKFARNQGDNIAVVSPRVDVVVEISQRIKNAFLHEDIDVLHQSRKQEFNGHFIISTIHQLYRYKNHFDIIIIIDEVDAFPLSMDDDLFKVIQTSSKQTACHIYMTVTPPQKLLSAISKDNVIKLPARFHRQPLPVPCFQYLKFNPKKVQFKLLNFLFQQIQRQRYTLVFFNHIDRMIKAFETYQGQISNLIYIHSEDERRFEKVQSLRAGNHVVVFTTTILERGFTMEKLDVVVIEADQFSKEALIQIAGRVGRKKQAPNGNVIYYHNGVSLSMMLARKDIKKMNQLGKQKGWLDI